MPLQSDLIPWLKNHAIRHLCLDSRHIGTGDAFVVLAGAIYDATQFILQAVERGATALIIEKNTWFGRNGADSALISGHIPYLIVPNLREQLSALAAAWYGHPSTALRLVGITGTNGKTSSSQWIAKGLLQLEQSAGTIGTLGCTGLPIPPKHDYTTPDTLSLHRWLRDFQENSIHTVAMEVSSHALDQHRTDDVHFHTALFTNLSRDHLDYHLSIDEYGEAKARLFTEHRVDHAVINIDNAWGQELARRWKTHHPDLPLLTLSLHQPADLNTVVYDSPAGLKLKMQTRYGTDTVLLPKLNGRFTASNVLGVIGVWLHLGLSWRQILSLLPDIEPVPGRMNRLGGCNGAPTIIIDYAHTADAIEKVLLTLQPLRDTTGGKLWCIFGAGGDRNPGKRPLMGIAATRYADKVVITSDNPRSKDPNLIAQSIYHGIPAESRHTVQIEVDRRAAIVQTLNATSPEDIVLIAGKGHEPYQEINGIRTPFSDMEEVRAWLNKRNTP